MSQTPILEVKDLVKHYPGVQAVKGVSFSIREGICFGLLGPNGAGKTTSIEVIEGISEPTSGSVLFKGQPAGPEFRRRSGIQFQKTALPDYLTCREAIELFGSFYPKQVSSDELAKLCRLEEYMDRDNDQLSGGQKQRLLLALALVNDPDILFLDEPTTGLDPQARRNFWDLIQEIKKRGKTVVLTTHYMEEAYVLCDEIAIMDQGKIISQGVPNELLREYFDEVVLALPIADVAKTLLDRLPWKYTERHGTVEIRTKETNKTLSFLIDEKVHLEHLNVRTHTLEDLFLALTGKELRV